MPAQVYIDGQRLERFYPISDVTDSTIYRTEGWSGDYQASVVFGAPPSFDASWLRKGALYEHREGGVRTWGGLVSEIEPGDALTIHAYGFGQQADEFRAVENPSGINLVPTSVPDDAIDYAIDTDGLQWTRNVSIGSAPILAAETELMDLNTVLNRRAADRGKRWYVDSFGDLTLVDDPATATWTTTAGTTYLGTADDQYVSHLYGFYISNLDPATGLPSAYDVVLAGPVGLREEMATRFGRKAYTIDLTSLGYMMGSAAQDNVDNRYLLIGARMGWTDPVELTPFNLRRIGGGRCSPLSMYGTKGAGSMLRMPGMMDTRSQPETRGAIDLILGEVVRKHDEQRVTAVPVGFVPRDFQGALNVQAPATGEAA